MLFWLGHWVDSVEIFTLPLSFSGVCDEGAVSGSACPATSCEYGIERSSERLFVPANQWQCWMAWITSPNLGWVSAALTFDTSAGIESEDLSQGPDLRTVKMRTMNNLLAPVLVVSAMVKDQVGY